MEWRSCSISRAAAARWGRGNAAQRGKTAHPFPASSASEAANETAGLLFLLSHSDYMRQAFLSRPDPAKWGSRSVGALARSYARKQPPAEPAASLCSRGARNCSLVTCTSTYPGASRTSAECRSRTRGRRHDSLADLPPSHLCRFEKYCDKNAYIGIYKNIRSIPVSFSQKGAAASPTHVFLSLKLAPPSQPRLLVSQGGGCVSIRCC